MLIFNRFIPFSTFTAVNLFGLIFVRKENRFTDVDLRHEQIHSRQMREMLYIPFYIFYGMEWIVRMLQYRKPLKAYFNISFEREAYANQSDKNYLRQRGFYAWLKYLRQKN